MDQILIAKIVSVIILGGFAIIFGLIPLGLNSYIKKIKNDDKKKNAFELIITIIVCFGAGVLLTTCLTHMIPEANEHMNEAVGKGIMTDTGFPLIEILTLAGFLLIYFVEEIVHLLSHRWSKPGRHLDGESTLSGGHNHEFVVKEVLSSSSHFKAGLRAFIIIVALGLHSVFEGMAIGLGLTSHHVWYLLFAIASHKFVIAFVIGMQFVVSGLSRNMVVSLICIFSSISPLGIIIGIFVTNANDQESTEQTVAITVLNGLTAGTLLYVVFFEVLEKERAKQKHGLIQVVSILVGFLFMILLSSIVMFMRGNDESEGGGHSCH
ncbi:zinc transporter ZIP3-like [Lepeophtheirus salmonis]|uniref:zinc transporter ZIP3-like n=1 Tax=Lepeophtheirus salmonis TaxID=72036 RepID=UPI001AE122D5|nr:zinc transporter ZIP1-like [Lepeophtheirus salmonis]XP_040567338.1 zinc transporter ZIP1-like [Lepeophtheirus salmonis]